MEFSFIDHLLAFIILVVFPALSVKNGKPDSEMVKMLPPKKDLYYTNGWLLIIAASLVLTVWNFQKRSWSVLGVKWPEINTLVIYSVLALAAFIIVDSLISFKKKDNATQQVDELSYFIPLNWKEYKPFMFLSFAAGFCEEVIYRAFLIQYLLFVGDGSAFTALYAIIIPAIAFGIGHRYQGWWAVLKIIFVGLLLGVIYLSSASLLLVIIIHVLIDLISGYVGMQYFRKYPVEIPKPSDVDTE